MTAHLIPPQLNLSGYAQADGLAVFYQSYGSGPPLLLVHGWGTDSIGNWIENGWVEALQQRHTVITLDVRGHGKSDKPHALDPFSYAAMSNDVLAVMDVLEIQQCGLLGYSMGSFIGAYLLGHHPQRFTSMVLGGIGDETEESAAQGLAIADALRATDASNVTHQYARQVRRYIKSNPNNDLESLAFSALKMWPEGYPLEVAGADIQNAKLPVLIINGADDHPYVDSADAFAAALPDGRHLRISGSDHMTAVSDQRFKNAVLEFLANV